MYLSETSPKLWDLQQFCICRREKEDLRFLFLVHNLHLSLRGENYLTLESCNIKSWWFISVWLAAIIVLFSKWQHWAPAGPLSRPMWQDNLKEFMLHVLCHSIRAVFKAVFILKKIASNIYEIPHMKVYKKEVIIFPPVPTSCFYWEVIIFHTS